MQQRLVCLSQCLMILSLMAFAFQELRADEAVGPTQRTERAKDAPQSLKELVDAVVAAKAEELPVSQMNAFASLFSIPQHSEQEVPVDAIPQRAEDQTGRACIVHRLRQPPRIDIILFKVTKEQDTMYLFLTSPDGKLVRAIQRKKDKDFTTTPFTGAEAEKLFREQVDFWEKWRAEREKKAAQEKAGKK